MTLISGLGGKDRLYEHAYNSAKVISAIKPEFVGFLTLMVEEGTKMYDLVHSGKFRLLSPSDVVEEMKIFISNVDSEGTVFRANHASNYISLAGNLNEDKQMLLNQIENVAKRNAFKPESYRGL